VFELGDWNFSKNNCTEPHQQKSKSRDLMHVLRRGTSRAVFVLRSCMMTGTGGSDGCQSRGGAGYFARQIRAKKKVYHAPQRSAPQKNAANEQTFGLLSLHFLVQRMSNVLEFCAKCNGFEQLSEFSWNSGKNWFYEISAKKSNLLELRRNSYFEVFVKLSFLKNEIVRKL
jgi:hypothetical protein